MLIGGVGYQLLLPPVKVKVKFTLVEALRLCTGHTAHRGSRGIALPFRDHGTRRGEGSASRLGRSFPPGKIRYPLYRRLGGPQGRSGQVRKISPPTGIRSPDRPARSQSLYRRRYPAHCYHLYGVIFKKTYARNRTEIPRFPVHSLVTMLTELSQINE